MADNECHPVAMIEGLGGGISAFPLTRWSLVLAAGTGSEERRHEALAQLCGSYWYPLYAYVRRRGANVQEAQDLTQGFFEHLLAARTLEELGGPDRGRLRSYLLMCMQNWMAKQHRDQNTLKRGGGKVFSLDALDAEQRYQLEPVDGDTPESLYERRWALQVLEGAFARLRKDYEAVGKGEQAAVLIPLLGRGEKAVRMVELGMQLDVSEGHARVLLHRMRKHFRAALADVIRETTDGREDVLKEELAHLQRVLMR